VQVAILGTGLIGSSIGLAARSAGFATVGWDLDPDAARASAAGGALDEVARSAAEAAACADVVVVAAPVDGTLALLRAFPAAPKAGLILDVASVKTPVVAAAKGLANFVPSHPLAGRELRGPRAAQADLFSGRTWAYVPPGDPALETRARSFIEALGARPLAISAERHDAVVALTSHLPQVVASALGSLLASRLDDPMVLALCGSGMRSMTRLAASDWSVWGSVLEANSVAVAQEVRALVGILRSVAEALEAGGVLPLATLFAQAAHGATELDRTPAARPSFLPSTPNDTTRGNV